MATKSSTAAVDLQKLINGAVQLELKALSAGVEYAQVWITQAAKLSAIAADTLKAMQDDKASLSGTARQLTEFGRQNAEAFSEVTARLSKRYFDELGRLTDSAEAAKATVVREVDAVKSTVLVKPVARRPTARSKRRSTQ
jgi:hypothetical protein